MDKYTDGMDMKKFERVAEISVYNHNYYRGFENDLLLAISDDDDTTEWLLIGHYKNQLLGYSRTSSGELLEKTDRVRN